MYLQMSVNLAKKRYPSATVNSLRYKIINKGIRL